MGTASRRGASFTVITTASCLAFPITNGKTFTAPTRAQLAGQTNIRWRANALQHAVLIGRGRRQGLGFSEHADPAGRAAALRCLGHCWDIAGRDGSVLIARPIRSRWQRCQGVSRITQAWVLLKRRAQLAFAGNKPEKRKDGKQNSRCVKVGLRGFVPWTQPQPKPEADAHMYPSDEQERDLHDAVERLRIPGASQYLHIMAPSKLSLMRVPVTCIAASKGMPKPRRYWSASSGFILSVRRCHRAKNASPTWITNAP
jgi:hypothetical protein